MIERVQGASWRLTKPNGLFTSGGPTGPDAKAGAQAAAGKRAQLWTGALEVICLPDGCGREADS